MADENTIDYPALCEELSARVAELEAALAEEQDKNAVLAQWSWTPRTRSSSASA